MADDPGYHRAKGMSDERIATPEEVWSAVQSLTDADSTRLKAVAEALAFRLRSYVWGTGGADLLQEAVISVLQGNRKWRPSRVDLVRLLVGAMRSIASNWKRKGELKQPPRLASDLITVDEHGEEVPTAVDAAADQRLNPEEVLLQGEAASRTQQLVSEIEEMFQEDVVASLVIEGLKTGMKGPEIMAKLEISRKEFDAAVKKIRRTTKARWRKGIPYVQ